MRTPIRLLLAVLTLLAVARYVQAQRALAEPAPYAVCAADPLLQP